MANPEHLKILKQGAQVWNDWRKWHAEIQPDLSNTDLSDAKLVKVNLSFTIFSSANLNNADLSGTNLRFADLTLTDLTRARLAHADLFSVNLSNANLSNANFSFAILRQATLNDTNFSNCELGFTILGGLDLSKSKGLESVHHNFPSVIGIDTIYKSRGEIPEVFLRGCGVPEEFIVYMRSLTAKPIQFYSCFISYSSKNQLFADRLYADLQNRGVRCWLASEDLKIGERIRVGIDESIRIHDKLMLVLSKQSVESDWVEQEVETALARERVEKRTILFPIRLDETVMKIETGWPALIRNTRNIGDFRRWKNPEAYQKAFERLLRDLKA